MKYAIEVLERERLKIKRQVLKVNRRRESLTATALSDFYRYDEDVSLWELDDAIEALQRTLVEAEQKAAGVTS